MRGTARTIRRLPALAGIAALGAAAPVAAYVAPGPSPQDAPGCIVMNTERLPLGSRLSPLDSVTFTVGGAPVKLCYSRPSARGRTVFGSLVPYGSLWRTGANEPTMIHTTRPLSIAGIRVPEGSYSLYTVPGPDEWVVVVNRSIDQWGHPSSYTSAVEAEEVGRARVPAGRTDSHVETFTIRAEPTSAGDARLVLEWERTRVAIPITGAEPEPE